MAIAVVCPGCGRRYRVEDRLAGKRLRCRCGQRLEVRNLEQSAGLSSGLGPSEEEDDWVAAAFAPPQSPRPNQVGSEGNPLPPGRHGRMGPGAEPVGQAPTGQSPLPTPLPVSVSQEEMADSGPFQPAGPADLSSRGPLPGEAPRDLLRHLQSVLAPVRRPRSKAAIRRLVVAWLAMAYGVVLTVLFLIRLIVDPPGGIFALSNRLAAIVLAGAIAVGGWLIFKRHPQGPAWAGLASVFLCFPTAWSLLITGLGHYSAGQWRSLGEVLLEGIGWFAVPVVVVAWCLKRELARQRRDGQRDEDPPHV